MRAFVITLAVLTMALTSGGVAYEETAEPGAEMSMSRAVESTGAEALPVCGLPPEGQAFVELPPLRRSERRGRPRVRSLRSTGYNQLSQAGWQPAAPIRPPPAAPAP